MRGSTSGDKKFVKLWNILCSVINSSVIESLNTTSSKSNLSNSFHGRQNPCNSIFDKKVLLTIPSEFVQNFEYQYVVAKQVNQVASKLPRLFSHSVLHADALSYLGYVIKGVDENALKVTEGCYNSSVWHATTSGVLDFIAPHISRHTISEMKAILANLEKYAPGYAVMSRALGPEMIQRIRYLITAFDRTGRCCNAKDNDGDFVKTGEESKLHGFALPVIPLNLDIDKLAGSQLAESILVPESCEKSEKIYNLFEAFLRGLDSDLLNSNLGSRFALWTLFGKDTKYHSVLRNIDKRLVEFAETTASLVKCSYIFAKLTDELTRGFDSLQKKSETSNIPSGMLRYWAAVFKSNYGTGVFTNCGGRDPWSLATGRSLSLMGSISDWIASRADQVGVDYYALRAHEEVEEYLGYRKELAENPDKLWDGEWGVDVSAAAVDWQRKPQNAMVKERGQFVPTGKLKDYSTEDYEINPAVRK